MIGTWLDAEVSLLKAPTIGRFAPKIPCIHAQRVFIQDSLKQAGLRLVGIASKALGARLHQLSPDVRSKVVHIVVSAEDKEVCFQQVTPLDRADNSFGRSFKALWMTLRYQKRRKMTGRACILRLQLSLTWPATTNRRWLRCSRQTRPSGPRSLSFCSTAMLGCGSQQHSS
jgi:hypothetical protein